MAEGIPQKPEAEDNNQQDPSQEPPKTPPGGQHRDPYNFSGLNYLQAFRPNSSLKAIPTSEAIVELALADDTLPPDQRLVIALSGLTAKEKQATRQEPGTEEPEKRKNL